MLGNKTGCLFLVPVLLSIGACLSGSHTDKKYGMYVTPYACIEHLSTSIGIILWRAKVDEQHTIGFTRSCYIGSKL